MTYNQTLKLMELRIDNINMTKMIDELSERAGKLLDVTDKDPSLLKNIAGYVPVLEDIRDKKASTRNYKFIRWMESEIGRRIKEGEAS